MIKVGEMENNESKVGLKREVGLASAVNFMISFVMGSGIFVTPGIVLDRCGSVGMTLLVWVLCGLLSFLSCLPFGELSTVVPKSGSIYIYLYTAFKDWHPVFGGLPAFIFFWMMYLIILPSSIAVSALLFADYTFVVSQEFMGDEPISNVELKKKILGASSLVVIGVVNCISVKLFVRSQDLLAYIKIAAIVIIMGSGVYLVASGQALHFDPGFEGTNLSVYGLTGALYFGLYSYDGGCFITTITEEMKNPEKNIMRSILIGLTITTVTYVLLNVTFLLALAPADVASGTTVIVTFATKLFGIGGGAVAAVVICLSLLSAIMSSVFYASRIGYVAAREGHLPEFMCCIHKTQQTPAPAVVAQVMLSMFHFFVGGNSSSLIDMYSFFVWLTYGVTMVTVFVLRRKMPNANRPFRVPSVVPVLVAIVSLYLFVISITAGQTKIIIAFVVCILLSSVTFYIFIYQEFRIKGLSKFLKKLQEVLGLMLPAEEPTY